MATLTEYFDSEARDYLAQLDRDLERPAPNPGELRRVARALRGSAQMAREDRVLRVAGALEAAARAVMMNALRWSDDVAMRARDTVADLRVLIDRQQDSAVLDAVADAAVARWRGAGVELPLHADRKAPEAGASASREFRAFAAREVSGIAEALDRGVQQLAAAPMDREPLKMILRRQRALLGAARLDEIPVVAEILRAVEDLTRVIAKLDVGVKREWLDIYRVAREGLRATIDPLQRDDDPQPSHSLSRLRHMREELLDRYGAGEVVSAAHDTAGFTRTTTIPHETEPPELLLDTLAEPELTDVDLEEEAELLLEDEVVLELDGDSIVEAPDAVLELDAASIVEAPDTLEERAAQEPAATAEIVVPIDTLLYDRAAALQRALELRSVLTNAHVSDHEARATLTELFDLIELALR